MIHSSLIKIFGIIRCQCLKDFIARYFRCYSTISVEELCLSTYGPAQPEWYHSLRKKLTCNKACVAFPCLNDLFDSQKTMHNFLVSLDPTTTNPEIRTNTHCSDRLFRIYLPFTHSTRPSNKTRNIQLIVQLKSCVILITYTLPTIWLSYVYMCSIMR